MYGLVTAYWHRPRPRRPPWSRPCAPPRPRPAPGSSWRPWLRPSVPGRGPGRPAAARRPVQHSAGEGVSDSIVRTLER